MKNSSNRFRLHLHTMGSKKAYFKAFTLVELLVSMTFLVIIMLVLTQVVGIVQRTWVRANSRVSQFREARMAFDVISRNVSQATLNVYWANESDPLGTDAAGQSITKAKNYVRQSELQFISGPTTQLLTSAASTKENYPGHAIFFQAPLGVTRLISATSSQTNTENMVNLLCGRGYFIEWGDDTSFRPPFLNQIKTVPTRSRLRLMEYSPTAEMNRIYDSTLRPIVDNTTGVNKGKLWFQDALASNNIVKSNESLTSLSGIRAATRPVAENILALVISPQVEVTGNTGTLPYAIAPKYLYDSTLKSNPGATASASSPQGTQHLLPPMLKVSMVALDQRAGETLSSDTKLRQEILQLTGTLFQDAASFVTDLDGTDDKSGTLEQLLISKKLGFRFFTTTIALKQSRWSF